MFRQRECNCNSHIGNSQFAAGQTRRLKDVIAIADGWRLRHRLISLALLVACSSAWGSITIDAHVSKNATSASNTISTPAFSTRSGGQLLLAYVATDWRSGANTIVTSVTGGGLTWHLVQRTNVQHGSAEIWGALASSRLNNLVVRANLSQDVFAAITVMSYEGVDRTGAIGAVGSGNALSGTPSARLVTTRKDSWVFGVGNDFDHAIGRTPAPDQRLVNQYLAPVGDTYWVQMEHAPTPSRGTTVVIRDTAPSGDRYNMSLVEIRSAQTYRISGRVTPASLGAGTFLTLTQKGIKSSTARADVLGHFAFPDLSDGTYMVSPSKSGHVFTPLTQNVTVKGANATTNFSVAAAGYTISGTIAGRGGAGATVSLSGAATASTTANASGFYTFGGLQRNRYRITPRHTGYAFFPFSKDIVISGANSTGNFTTSPTRAWSISGTVSPAASGVLVALNGTTSGATTTDAAGNYTFPGLVSGTYSLTPSQSGYTFTPASLAVAVNRANVVGENFTRQQAATGKIAIDATASGNSALAQATVSTPSFSTNASNELLLAFVAADSTSSPNTTVDSISGGGLGWTLVQRTNVQAGTSEIWRTFASTRLNNVTVTASLSQSVMSSITVISYTGVDLTTTDGSGAIGAVATGNASSGAPTASVITTRDNSWVFGVGNDFDNAIARTPAAGQSLIHEYLTVAGDTYWVQMQNAATVSAGTTVSIDDIAPTGDRYNLSVVEILPALAAGKWSVAGNISPSASGSGATVNLSGAQSGTTQADASGNYTLANLVDGNYAVTPAKSGFSFAPVSAAVTISGANSTGVSFVATQAAASYSLSGAISPASASSGSTIKLSGPISASTTVNSVGTYVFSGVPAGSYTVTPANQSATFSPTSKTVTIGTSSVSGVDFTATTTANIIFYDDFTGTSLSSAWTVISRHGEYSQNETECNTPLQARVANGFLTITTTAQSATCGDFNIDGSVRNAPSSWPYTTGDVQWKNFNFTYGTVEIRAKFPAKGTGLWPALWLLGSNCQVTNPFTADTGYSTCPNLSSSSYAEIDMVECDLNNWCQLALSNPGNFPTCGFTVDSNFHVFTLKWTPTAVGVAVDGQDTGCGFTSGSMTIPSTPMFLIMQTQTGGAGGNPNDPLLPAQFVIDYVKVTQP